jgi:hypothetical protein
MNLKLNHINIQGLTTDALHEDMRTRMATSKGAPVLYPYETVEALLAKIEDLGNTLNLARHTMVTVQDGLPEASTKESRVALQARITRTVNRIDGVLGAPASKQDNQEDW